MINSIVIEQKDSIATIKFNRPDSYNSLNFAMVEALAVATQQIRTDASIRCLVLCGVGKAFMSGGDIGYFNQQLEQEQTEILKLGGLVNQVILNLTEMNKPVIAAVHGSVAGIGVSLMLAADLVVANRETKFNLAYTQLGTSPDGGASYQLPRTVGIKKAMQLLLLSEQFDTEVALQLGLINWSVPTDEMQAKVTELAMQLSSGPTLAYGRVKRLVRESHSAEFSQHLNQEIHAFKSSMETADFKQGVKAFINKSKPEFKGK